MKNNEKISGKKFSIPQRATVCRGTIQGDVQGRTEENKVRDDHFSLLFSFLLCYAYLSFDRRKNLRPGKPTSFQQGQHKYFCAY
jgi:hypothetical protein